MTQPGHELIASLIEAKDFGGAAAELGRLFAATPTPATAQLVLQQVAKFEGRLPRQEVKVAFLRSFTIEPVFALLKACLALRGIDAELQVGDFNTYAQDILNPASSLYGFNPQIVVLAVQTRDLVPDLWSRFAELSAEDVAARVSEAAQSLRGLFGAFRSQSQAHLIVHNLEEPALASHGIYDAQSAVSQTHAIRQINDELGQTAREHAGVYVLDYDALIARKGRERWHDELKWLTARMPIAADCLIHLAREYERFFLPLLGRSCKALVVDLDNTLWGGVIGEDGMQGIRVGQEYPGATYYALQRAILDLHQRGILLAVASKNNPEDAMEVLRDHPGMLLRPEHFSAMRINWADKAMNLRQIATELNIGIDALAFLDDNPIERKRVQSELPEVTVIDLPDSPASYAKALRECLSSSG